MQPVVNSVICDMQHIPGNPGKNNSRFISFPLSSSPCPHVPVSLQFPSLVTLNPFDRLMAGRALQSIYSAAAGSSQYLHLPKERRHISVVEFLSV